MPDLNIGIIGYGFMGRAHTNAYKRVNDFFDLKYRPRLKAVCARDAAKAQAFADNWKLFLTTGVCGGFTTFSAFSAENLLLLQNGRFSIAFLYIGVSIIAGIGAAWLGFKLFNLNS